MSEVDWNDWADEEFGLTALTQPQEPSAEKFRKGYQSTQQSGNNNQMNSLFNKYYEKFSGGQQFGNAQPASSGGTPGGGGGSGGVPTMGGGGGTGGAAGGGMGAGGIAAIIAAAIAAQHAMSHNTDTEFEGVETKDAFSGHFGTEPWMAFLHDKLGLGPTAGEKFDAAVKNDDWGLAAKRSVAASEYWSNPARSWTESGVKKLVGEENAKKYKYIDPMAYLLSKIED